MTSDHDRNSGFKQPNPNDETNQNKKNPSHESGQHLPSQQDPSKKDPSHADDPRKRSGEDVDQGEKRRA